MLSCAKALTYSAGWSSLVARRAHNPEAGGSNPPPATKSPGQRRFLSLTFFFFASTRVDGALRRRLRGDLPDPLPGLPQDGRAGRMRGESPACAVASGGAGDNGAARGRPRPPSQRRRARSVSRFPRMSYGLKAPPPRLSARLPDHINRTETGRPCVARDAPEEHRIPGGAPWRRREGPPRARGGLNLNLNLPQIR